MLHHQVLLLLPPTLRSLKTLPIDLTKPYTNPYSTDLNNYLTYTSITLY